MNLISYLSKKGVLEKGKAASLELEAKSSGKKEEELILEKGIVSESFLFGLKSEVLKIPLKEVVLEEVSLKVLELIPEDSARYYKMVPLDKKDEVFEIGMVYPEDLSAQEALKFLARRSGFSYRVFLITISSFENVIRQYRNLKKEVTRALKELESELQPELKEEKVGEVSKRELAEEAPVIKMVAVILRHAVDGKASDIHIEPKRDKSRVRFRVDGVLHSSILLPLRVHPVVVARIKILSNLKIDETRVPQDGRFSIRLNEQNIDFRVSTFPTTLGEKVAIRVLDPSEGMKSFDKLGLEGRNFKLVESAVQKPYGMILTTGPTGSGKTTTLYAILNLLNEEGVNIVTLEDPVEYFIEGVNQSQIRPEIGYTFGQGLRQIVRQDPDIIMVGEIRDEETADLAIHAALTGHIVLSTLHTNTAPGTIARLIDMGVQPFLIPSTLSVAIAQRLARRLCPHCKKAVKAKKEIRDLISKEIEFIPSVAKKDIKIPSFETVYEPQGCKKCNLKGFSGRVGIFEVLPMSGEIADIILKSPQERKIYDEAVREGMITMKQDGIIKALQGLTTVEEVLRVAEEKQRTI